MRPIEHFGCQNASCPDYGQRAQGNLYCRGCSGRNRRIRMASCRTGKKAFSERKGTPREGGRLPQDKAVALLEHIREGCGTRATSRLLPVDKNTLTPCLRLAGPHAPQRHHEKVAFSPHDP